MISSEQPQYLPKSWEKLGVGTPIIFGKLICRIYIAGFTTPCITYNTQVSPEANSMHNNLYYNAVPFAIWDVLSIPNQTNLIQNTDQPQKRPGYHLIVIQKVKEPNSDNQNLSLDHPSKNHMIPAIEQRWKIQ